MKKTLALALTAAMAISAVSATAFAASVDVKSDLEPWERVGTITIKDEDLAESTTAEVKNLPTLDSDDVYKFLGWTTEENVNTETAYAVTSDDAAAKTYKTYKDLFTADALGNQATVAESAKDKEATIYPVFRRWKNQKELDKWKEDNGKNAQSEAEKKAFEDKLKAADESHNATNNWNTGKTIKTDKIEAGKGKVAAKENAPVMAPSNGHDSQVAGIGDHDVAFYWDGTKTSAKADAKGNKPDLISGKSTRLELELPEDYTTKDMDVTVYDIDGWCKATKVKKADMMTNGNKVYVWTSNPGHRFIVTLNPRGASTGSDKSNPATGDFSALPIAMLAVAALGATGFVAYKKRMAE